jgi:drug/metabolite transporter (DMT)-like permease
MLFAGRDNVLRWAAKGSHPAPLLASTATLLGATLFLSGYLLTRRHFKLAALPSRVGAFAPAGLCLAGGYGTLLTAFTHGRVGVVAPLNATGSFWAVILAAVLVGRSEMIGRRTVAAGLLVVIGSALISAEA